MNFNKRSLSLDVFVGAVADLMSNYPTECISCIVALQWICHLNKRLRKTMWVWKRYSGFDDLWSCIKGYIFKRVSRWLQNATFGRGLRGTIHTIEYVPKHSTADIVTENTAWKMSFFTAKELGNEYLNELLLMSIPCITIEDSAC